MTWDETHERAISEPHLPYYASPVGIEELHCYHPRAQPPFPKTVDFPDPNKWRKALVFIPIGEALDCPLSPSEASNDGGSHG